MLVYQRVPLIFPYSFPTQSLAVAHALNEGDPSQELQHVLLLQQWHGTEQRSMESMGLLRPKSPIGGKHHQGLIFLGVMRNQAQLTQLTQLIWVWINTYRYIFSGMNIHLPAILGFTRYQGFDPSPYFWWKRQQ